MTVLDELLDERWVVNMAGDNVLGPRGAVVTHVWPTTPTVVRFDENERRKAIVNIIVLGKRALAEIREIGRNAHVAAESFTEELEDIYLELEDLEKRLT